jgi:uncharacterized delta-60 repeat protein
MKKTFYHIFIVPVLFTGIYQAPAQGTLDSGFNTGTGADDAVQALATQSDGRIICAGLFDDINGTTNSLGIARLNTDGSVDATFNPGTSVDDGINSVAIQSDGKIILGGGFTQYQGVSRPGITRINADGSLDTTFNPGTGVNDQITSVALQPDGKAVIAGYFTTYNGTARNGMARLNANGTLDTTFNPGSGVDYAVWSASVLTNGTILIGGGFTLYNGTSRRGVARINPNGSVDTTFNPGTVSVNNLVRTVLVQPDGKVIIGGDFTTFNGISRNRIARLNADGTLDTTFSSGSGANNSVECLALQPNGKLLIGGTFTTINSIARNSIARLLPNGNLDANFNPGTGANGTVEALALQSDAKVVLGGTFTTFNGAADIRLARLLLSDSQSMPLVAAIKQSQGNIVLSWNSVNNGIYRVDYKSLLNTNNWTALTPYTLATGTIASATNSVGTNTQGYYRTAFLPY